MEAEITVPNECLTSRKLSARWFVCMPEIQLLFAVVRLKAVSTQGSEPGPPPALHAVYEHGVV